MSLFDEDLQEVEIDQVRYILRYNIHRKQELSIHQLHTRHICYK